jgi:hypothetical protein
MEKRYKVGLIGALLFAFLTLILNFVFGIPLLKSEGIALIISLTISAIVYKLIK